MRVVKLVLPPVLTLVVVVVGCQWLLRVMQVKAYLVPPPTAVGVVFREEWRDLLMSTWMTGRAALVGFAMAAGVGVLSAVVLSASRWVERAFYPYTVFFQTVPIVAVAPLLVLWFGAGLKAVAISAFIVAVFPVIANTLAGLRSVDPALRDLFRLYGAGRVATLVKLSLPAALPNVITGFRIASGLAVIGAIVGEFVASSLDENAGLGIRILAANRQGNVDEVFAAVLAASVLGLCLFAGINLLGWVLLRRWHASAG